MPSVNSSAPSSSVSTQKYQMLTKLTSFRYSVICGNSRTNSSISAVYIMCVVNSVRENGNKNMQAINPDA